MFNSRLCKHLQPHRHFIPVRSLSKQFKVFYKERGDPNKVLEVFTKDQASDFDAKYGQSYVNIKMLAAPVNPADINMIQGVYPIKPELPAVGGNEGCGVVVDKGNDVKDLSVGDYVLPRVSGWGTWRRYGVGFEKDFLRVPRDISPLHASMLSVNACTAYRMLTDFCNFNPGDIVIQNGGNSGVGQSVIQMAKNRGLQTISIIRNRPNVDALVEELKALGADYVIIEHDGTSTDMEMKHLMSHLPKAKLALNCVGGKVSAKLLRYMDKRSTMVTYGGMSKMPLMVPAGPLIFNDIRLTGFWMTRWNEENLDTPEYKKMWKDIFAMLKNGTFKVAKHNVVPIENYQTAIADAMKVYNNKKQVLVMDKSMLK